MIQDLRFAFRTLRRAPGFSAIAVATLALGIGANVAVFALVYAVVLRPLPFVNPDRLVDVAEARLDTRVRSYSSLLNYTDWVAQCRVLEALAAYTDAGFTLTDGATAERLSSTQVTANLFTVLGVQPAIGRAFTAEEDRPGSAAVVVLSHELWRRRFDADRGILGRSVTLNSRPTLVVGVMPEGFRFPIQPLAVDIYTPIHQDAFPQMQVRDGRLIHVLGRLGAGSSIDAAQSEMDTIAARLAVDHPATNAGWGVQVASLHEAVTGSTRTPLLMLLGAVVFVLLIACANLANLFLARAAGRREEIAVRLALGAGRGRLFRQLAAESIVVCAAGGAAGVIAFTWLRDSLVRVTPAVPRLGDVAFGSPVVVFAVAASAVAALFIGAASATALRGSAAVVAPGAVRGAAGGAGTRIRSTLVAVEVALSLVLLAGATLFSRSLLAVLSVEQGLQTRSLLTAHFDLGSGAYPDGVSRARFYTSLLERVSALPAVTSAAVTFPEALGSSVAFPFLTEGSAAPRRLGAYYRAVSAGYFGTLGVPLLRGRVFSEADGAAALPVVVINRTMASRYWPDRDPIGQRITVIDRNDGDRATSREIVGVVGDVAHLGPDRPAGPQMYVPHTQAPSLWMSILVRTDRPDIVANRLAAEVRAVDPSIPMTGLEPLDATLDRLVSPRRFSALLTSAFAALAALLTLVGIWGVTAYAVTQRVPEIAIRMALGADRRTVTLMFVGGAVRMTAVGIAIGVAALAPLSGVLSRLLFGVRPMDPAVIAGTGAVFLVLTVLAAGLPARRASRIDPIEALRRP